jgi:alcohol dehydrogenase class IV
MHLFDMPAEVRVVEMAWPTRVVLGAGALSRLPQLVQRLGMARPLVVTDAGVVRAGIAARVYGVLGRAGVPFAAFEGVEPNPTERDVEEGLAAYRREGCDGLVALGGGSPLDAAKLVQLRTTHPPPLSRYDDAAGGDRYIEGGLPPLIAIPTTAGTGSEVSRSGVVTLADTGRKTVIFSPHLLPRAALCDPELTVGLPPGPTAATGMDAFTHCLEAFVAEGFHPLADAVALDGMRRVARSLPVAVREGRDVAARTDMMVAAMQGAMAFQKGLGAAHALAHALTPLCGTHHGLANALVLPAVMDFNLSAAPERLAQVAVALGEDAREGTGALARRAVERVRALCLELGLPASLRHAGVREELLGEVAAKAYQDASHRTNPRPCTEEDLFAIARAAY